MPGGNLGGRLGRHLYMHSKIGWDSGPLSGPAYCHSGTMDAQLFMPRYCAQSQQQLCTAIIQPVRDWIN